MEGGDLNVEKKLQSKEKEIEKIGCSFNFLKIYSDLVETFCEFIFGLLYKFPNCQSYFNRWQNNRSSHAVI